MPTSEAGDRRDPDEISLVDLFLVLARRKYWIFAVLVPCLAVGTAYAVLTTPVYRYTTGIEIGSRVVDDDVVPIEAPAAAATKIEEIYIPFARQELLERGGQSIGISVSVPGDGQVVVLSSEGPAAAAEAHAHLHEAVFGALQDDHQRILDIQQRQMRMALENARRSLAALEDQGRAIQVRLDRLDDREALVDRQIEALESMVADVTDRRARAVGEAATDQARAMTFLMLTNELDRNRDRLAALQERLVFELPDERTDLTSALADNRRRQSEQADEIEVLDLRLENFQMTEPIAPTLRSGDPVAPRVPVVMGLSGVLGLIGGIAAAFLIEFAAAVRRRAREEPAEPPRPLAEARPAPKAVGDRR